MRRFVYLILMFVVVGTAIAADGDWRIYASYHNATKAVKVGSQIYVLANGGMYSYDTEDESVELYDKTNALSDFGLNDIAYCAAAKKLVVLYSNGNIDLMTVGDDTWNMPELKNKTLNDKTLNELSVFGAEAFVSTNSGLVCINVKDGYFVNMYDFGMKVLSCLANTKTIYAKTPSGIYKGDRTKNLLDVSEWVLMTDAQLKADAVYASLKNENVNDKEALATVAKIVPDSPLRNYSYKLNMQGSRLLVAGGNFYYPNVQYPGTVMKYESNSWSAFDEAGPIALVGADAYQNVTDVVQDPEDSEHHWIGTMRSGIYEFKDYKMVAHYSYDNSPITSILPNDKHADLYVRTTALALDPDGNLWMMNNECETVVRILKKDRTWRAYKYKELETHPTFDHTIFDRRGWAWISQRRTTNKHYAGIMVINTNGTIDSQSDDQYRFLTSFRNQDGTAYTPNLYYCMKEDLNGYMWIGTNEGLFVSYNPETIFDNDFYLSQVKVPRNDGSDLADYLLAGVSVKCIAIDGGNRKWIGTLNNGVYLISADGLEILQHFTKDDSPLISDAINDIAVNGQTGEVFIATDAGLCSYHGDATDAAESMDNTTLKVYPNPVRPEYSGNVHISGLMQNSDVKIVNAAGNLVVQGTSVGGQYNWDCRYGTGKKVASGIYYVLATDENGKNGACCKILVVK